jgi:hypothetical protein
VSDTYALLGPYDRERPVTITGRPYVHCRIAAVELDASVGDPGGRQGPRRPVGELALHGVPIGQGLDHSEGGEPYGGDGNR